MNAQKNPLSEITLFLPGIVLAILGTSFGMYWLINVDVASGLELAKHVLAGKSLYGEVIDHQFPAIYFIYTFIVIFSNSLGIGAINGFFIFAFILLSACVWIAWRILKANPLFQSHATLFIFVFYFATFILPFTENNWHLSFGEREHLFCVLILPYLVLGINRLHSVEVNLKLIVTAGVLAFFGFAIKPYFLLIFFTSEVFITLYGWRRSKNISFQQCLRTETLIILIMLFGYYLGIIFLKPEYFRLIPHVVDLYRGIALPWQVMLQLCLIFSVAPLLLLLWFLIEKKLRAEWIFVPYLFCLSIASIVVFALGVGGFYYHDFPFRFISLLLLAFMMCTHPRKMFSLIFLLLLAMLMLKFSTQHLSAASTKRNYVFTLANTMRQYAPGGTVVPLDTDLAPSFPAINYAQVSYGLETPVLMHLPFAFKDYLNGSKPPPYHEPGQMGKMERFYHEIVMSNLINAPPDLIVVNVSNYRGWLRTMPFNFIDYFSKDARFLKLWKTYRWVERVSDTSHSSVFDFYQRKETSEYKE